MIKCISSFFKSFLSTYAFDMSKHMCIKMLTFSGYIFIIFNLAACQSLPALYTTLEKIEDDTAVKVSVSQEAIQKQTDIDINIKITNKDKKDEL